MSTYSSTHPTALSTAGQPATQAAPPAVPMRSGMDRLRHVLLFEAFALAITIPSGSALFGLHESAMGVIGIGSAITAMVWNYLYNIAFDRVMGRLYHTTRKTMRVRVVHTLVFEAGLQLALVPGIALYTHASMVATLPLSLSLALFYLAYAFLFNMAYDRLFPLPHRG
ncbi:PACE efflux transporter [Acetobacter lambici]|uniref:PACE efflux transporter n=1 Tax=Acetobacter lambici TaxID=1332824 RepID=A0ABT1EZ95_9PROT|nr:PACE efflux transporter [Acetobacter lambici]MCP1242249.1 PACE efflux transporter [Acetobacter lambici]MCP1258266.1 PACE efflux transporter [Acetobacter lambici]